MITLLAIHSQSSDTNTIHENINHSNGFILTGDLEESITFPDL